MHLHLQLCFTLCLKRIFAVLQAELEAPPKAPLTEEEKKEKLAKLEELRVKKRFDNRFSQSDILSYLFSLGQRGWRRKRPRRRKKRRDELRAGKTWGRSGTAVITIVLTVHT